MISFTTDDVAPNERFDQWREVRGKALFGMTIELDARRRPAFHGTFWARNVGSTAVASELTGSSYRISRTETDIARGADNSLNISHQIRGPGALIAGRGGVQIIHDGDMTTHYSDLPCAAVPSGEGDFRIQVLKVPVDDDLTLGRPVHDMFATGLMEGKAFSQPFRALFRALIGDPGRLSDPDRDVAHVARLAMMARGRLAPAMPEVRAARRAGLRYAALEIMERDQHKAALTPAMVATELGISVRQLHIVFEEAEASFARTLSRMRAAQARRLLAGAPTIAVTQIAHACGFDSIATFYRVFRACYGMAPGDARETMAVDPKD